VTICLLHVTLVQRSGIYNGEFYLKKKRRNLKSIKYFCVKERVPAKRLVRCPRDLHYIQNYSQSVPFSSLFIKWPYT